MRAVLAHRSDSGTLDQDGCRAVLELWRREPSPAAPAASATAAGLPAEDEAAFEEASRLLVEPYAAVHAVSALRCKIAISGMFESD